MHYVPVATTVADGVTVGYVDVVGEVVTVVDEDDDD